MEPAAPEGVVIRTIDDHRRPARGWSRILVVVLAVLGLVILGPAVVTLIRDPGDAPVVRSLNIAAGALHVLAAVCVAHNGRRMRMIGWMSLTALLTGAVLFGLLTWTGTAPGLEVSVWADGGRRLAFLPLILVAAALGWTATDGFDLMLWAKTAVTVMALLIVSSVASNVLARATVRTDAKLDPRTEPNDLKSET